MSPPSPLLPLLLAQSLGDPGASCLTGLCGLVQPYRPVPPGVFFLALGLVALGVLGLKRRTG